MPRDNTTRICSNPDMECFKSIKEEMLLLEFNLTKSSDSTIKTLCGCLPSCTFTSYDAEVSEKHQYNQGRSGKKEWMNGRIYSRLSIFFKEFEFTSLKRSELYGTTGFVSNCGGLLGE